MVTVRTRVSWTGLFHCSTWVLCLVFSSSQNGMQFSSMQMIFAKHCVSEPFDDWHQETPPPKMTKKVVSGAFATKPLFWICYTHIYVYNEGCRSRNYKYESWQLSPCLEYRVQPTWASSCECCTSGQKPCVTFVLWRKYGPSMVYSKWFWFVSVTKHPWTTLRHIWQCLMLDSFTVQLNGDRSCSCTL